MTVRLQALKDSKKVVAEYGTQEDAMKGVADNHAALREVEQKRWDELKIANDKVQSLFRYNIINHWGDHRCP